MSINSNKRKVALCTGITGQDGCYLAELLLSKGYEVHGIKRRSSSFNTERIDHLYEDPHINNRHLILHYGDLNDTACITRIIQEIKPDEIYNLGAMSHVKVSFDIPEYTADVDGIGTLRILEAVRLLGLTDTKIYQASSSELYGLVQETPQTEKTPFYPRSPYAVAKLYAYWMIVNYREAYNMFACNGILFNHESPVRGETFVTRKITMGAAKIALGLDKKLYLGNLNSMRDWGHAKDYVEAMWLMMQQDKPQDFVIATGITTSVRDFVRMAFNEVGIEIEFRGEGEKEIGVIKSLTNMDLITYAYNTLNVGDEIVCVDPRYYRPSEVECLIGDPSKANQILGWKPKYNLNMLVKEMIISDVKMFKGEKLLMDNGFKTKNKFE